MGQQSRTAFVMKKQPSDVSNPFLADAHVLIENEEEDTPVASLPATRPSKTTKKLGVGKGDLDLGSAGSLQRGGRLKDDDVDDGSTSISVSKRRSSRGHDLLAEGSGEATTAAADLW